MRPQGDRDDPASLPRPVCRGRLPGAPASAVRRSLRFGDGRLFDITKKTRPIMRDLLERDDIANFVNQSF